MALSLPVLATRGSVLVLVIGVALVPAPALTQSPSTKRLQQLLAAEDRRAADGADLALLQRTARDVGALPAERLIAIRALGRLERPDQLPVLAPLLGDARLELRLETINAIGQATQGLTTTAAADGKRVMETAERLRLHASTHRTAPELAAVARTLGRLPYADSTSGRTAQRMLLAVAWMERGTAVAAARRSPGLLSPGVVHAALHGLYDLARARRRLGDLTPEAGRFAADVVRLTSGPWRTSTVGVEARRLALLTLTANGTFDATLVRLALGERGDAQLRRLAVALAGAGKDSALWRRTARAALADPSFMVRFEGVRVWRQRLAAADCAPLISATRDADFQVRLAAIDAVSSCRNREVAARALAPALTAKRGQWHERAHAIVALARLNPARARLLLADASREAVPQMRVYAARAAAIVNDSAVLSRLAFDPVGNVREAAIDGLSAAVGHVADGVFSRALSSPQYQAVLAAARALKGTPAPDSALPPLLSALDRLTAEQRDNSRDPRLEVLARIGELGSAKLRERLRPYASDFDPAVATRAASVLTRWTGRAIAAAPVRRVEVSPSLGEIVSAHAVTLSITMVSPTGNHGEVELALRPGQAPATVARLVSLAQRGYFDGLTFHRVEPNFVIQGGSPAATEFVGDAAFLRDELAMVSHTRGTVGISTRGRDTGDAQIFVNLVDNFRLDHNYTVVGDVVRGMEVVDRIVEGDVMRSVVVRVR